MTEAPEKHQFIGVGENHKSPNGNGVSGQMGLSGKLLVLTILFVMIAEVLIFLPSVANFRVNWLTERLAAAQIASLAAEAAPSGELPGMLRDELLRSAMVQAVALKRNNERRLILQSDMPSAVDGHYDLRDTSSVELVIDALLVYFRQEDRVIRVLNSANYGAGEFVEIVISEAPLKADMINFGLNILGLSIIISMITAALVYWALNWLLIRPMMNITSNIVRYGANPEDINRIIEPTGRNDELGIAERELASMQAQLSQLLKEKNHLAALGLAVSKINHDLRNMLANAQLISDRFGAVQEPLVQRFAPKLIQSLDRAIELCTQTLKYGSAQEAPPARRKFSLTLLLGEISEGLGLPRNGSENPIAWTVDAPADLEINADRDQFFRILSNIIRNSVEVMKATPNPANEIRVRASNSADMTIIEIADTGPGVPEQARAHLFEAFKGSARVGGTGLGLAIAAELIRAHGGDIELVPTEKGALFRMTLPN